MTKTQTYKVWIVFGGHNTVAGLGKDAIYEYEYPTLSELNAFLDGLVAMDGWSDFEQCDTYEDALEFVGQYSNDDEVSA